MKKQALKNTVIKSVTVIFLCIGVLFLSAFTTGNQQSDCMTRLEMASLMEEILSDAGIDSNVSSLPSFCDLGELQSKSISKVLRFKLMGGFTDKTFRPSTPMRNLEVISYLQKLTELIRMIDPESEQSKKLFRFLSYNEDHGFAFEYNSSNLPIGLQNPNEQTSKNTLNELYYILTSRSSNYYVISGQIISCIDGKPISHAFISVNEKAVSVDHKGQFNIELSKDSDIADIFAAADGYQPTELRKDLNFGSNVTIRLRPGI